jgi:hypothetical protein
MPRNSQSLMFSYGAGTSFLQTSVSISNSGVFPVAFNQEEATKFTEVRALLAETMTRIIQREPNTNAILGTIAEGRGKLSELSKNMA